MDKHYIVCVDKKNANMRHLLFGMFFLIHLSVIAQLAEIPVQYETDAVMNPSGADDPSIWIHPTDRTLSLFLGTDKKNPGGRLEIYNLNGEKIQTLAEGKAINNVDVRYNFLFENERVDIITACNNSDKTIEIWKINITNNTFTNITGNTFTGLNSHYGWKMYHNPCTDKFYGFLSQKNINDGTVYQYELIDNGLGGVDISLVRTIDNLPSLVEGLVADDLLEHLYIGEEDVGIWKYGANPEDGNTRTLMDSVSGPNLSADIEGLTIYYSDANNGYLIASSQGNNRFAVYTREGNNQFIGSFTLVFGAEDGVEESDGIAVTSFPLGEPFETGAFIAHDLINTNPGTYPNYKLIPWGDIANEMNLRIDTTFSPRLMTSKPPKLISSYDTICTQNPEPVILSVHPHLANNVVWSTSETSPSISVSEPGSYYATLTNFCNATVSTDTISIVQDFCLGINEEQKPITWSVYPNPTNENISINQTYSSNLNVMIYNLVGQLVLDQQLQQGKTEIEISSLTPGNYLLKLMDSHTLLGAKMFIKTAK